MNRYQSAEEALRGITDDAASTAYEYLEVEKPLSLDAIKRLVYYDEWQPDEIMKIFNKTYGPTEEKTMHKIGLVVEAMCHDRDSGEH